MVGQIGGKPDLIAKAIGVMSDFYAENPLRRNDNPYEQSPVSVGNEDDLERTRGRADGGSNGQTPDDGGRSQRSQNGHGQQDGTPILNGNKTGEYPPEQTIENGKPASPQSQPASNALGPSETVTADSTQQPLDDPGSSDAALKEAANDPATHGANYDTNGSGSLLANQTNPATDATKRKDIDEEENPDAKRIKTDTGSGGESAPMIMSEGSEEGELEE